MTSSRRTVKRGSTSSSSLKTDDMDRGAAKIKLLKDAFADIETEIPWSSASVTTRSTTVMR